MKHLLTALLLCSLSGCGDGGPTDNTAVPQQGQAPSTSTVTVADAGPDMTVQVGQTATIVGKVPTGADPICWSVRSRPDSSKAGIRSGSGLVVLVVPDVPGQYVVALGCQEPNPSNIPYYDEMILTATGSASPPPPVVEAPAPIVLTTLRFEVGSANGDVSGTFTYPAKAAATSQNRGGLQNSIYTPVKWIFEVHSSAFGDTVLSSDQAGHTAEWCVGSCTFGSPSQVRLDVKDGTGKHFHFAFLLTTPTSELPPFEQIGRFEQAVLRNPELFIIFDSGGVLTKLPDTEVEA